MVIIPQKKSPNGSVEQPGCLQLTAICYALILLSVTSIFVRLHRKVYNVLGKTIHYHVVHPNSRTSTEQPLETYLKLLSTFFENINLSRESTVALEQAATLFSTLNSATGIQAVTVKPEAYSSCEEVTGRSDDGSALDVIYDSVKKPEINDKAKFEFRAISDRDRIVDGRITACLALPGTTVDEVLAPIFRNVLHHMHERSFNST